MSDGFRTRTLIPLALGAALALPAAPALAKSTACSRLKGRDEAASQRVKVVSKRVAGGGKVLRACLTARGPVRSLARSERGTDVSSEYRILQVAGRYVLVQTSILTAGDNQERTTVFDLRDGSSYDAAKADVPSAISNSTTSVNTIIDRRGYALALLAIPNRYDQRLVAYGPTGAAQELDTGDSPGVIEADSLGITPTAVVWTHEDAAQTAPLPPA